MLNKMLIAVFFSLLVIVLVEVGVVFLINSKQPVSQNIAINAQLSQPPQPSIVQPTTILSSYDYWNSKKGVLTSSYKIDTSEGIITSLDTKGGSMLLNNKKYPYVLKFVLQQKSNNYTFIFDNEDLKVLKLLRKNQNNTISPLQIDTLKNNDKVEIKQTVSLLETNVRPTEIIITVSNK